MRQDRQGCHPAKLWAHDKGPSHQDPIAKGVNAVAEQDRPTPSKRTLRALSIIQVPERLIGMITLMLMLMLMLLRVRVRVVMAMAMLMTVVPELSFVQEKKENQTHEQNQKQIGRTHLGFKGLGQEV